MIKLNQKGMSLVEMVVALGIVAAIGSIAFEVMRSGNQSAQKIIRSTETDQLISEFLDARKKELQLTQQEPRGQSLIPPFLPLTGQLLLVGDPIVLAENLNIAIPTGSACDVVPPPLVGQPTRVLPGFTNPLLVYTRAGAPCKRIDELVWRGLTINKRVPGPAGDVFTDFTFVSSCRALPQGYPDNFPTRVGLIDCPAGQTSFIADSIMPNPNYIFPMGNLNVAGNAPLAASLVMQRRERTMQLILTVIIPNGSGGFESKTKEIASSIPRQGDPAPRVQIIR